MKVITIRFIEHTRYGKINYRIERLTSIFKRWKEIGYWQAGGVGDSVWYAYEEREKEKVLKKVLEHYYETPESKVVIIEHPTIKIY